MLFRKPQHRSLFSTKKYGKGKGISRWLFLLLLISIGVAIYHVNKPLPPGVDFSGPQRTANEVQFLADRTYTVDGERQTQQQIFDEVFEMIANARHLVLVDMFLFNDYQGKGSEQHRALSDELTEALIAQKKRYPDLQIQLISDPINSVYGGLPSKHFAKLKAAGIPVILTNLSKLRDSNPAYSGFWRLFVQPFGNKEGGWLPNPFGEGEVSIKSYLNLMNFKANHRKLIIADNGEQLTALVTSANPHDGSSAHDNVALRFNGQAAWDLLDSEKAVLAMSGKALPKVELEQPSDNTETNLTVQVVTEQAVEKAALAMINQTKAGDKLDMAMFYLSDREIIDALKSAQKRGVTLRVLLDPNKDAFGREKNGIPNRPVAHELTQTGITVRWCDTHGEQCHAKWLMHRGADETTMLLGSTNFTRRNLDNLNLETSVVLTGPANAVPLRRGQSWFDECWYNLYGRHYSVDYENYADERLWPRLLYRGMEATGLSTF
ncbi:phospholipase D family protein [Methylophaga sulfidovorans]|uniref:phospholipase D n=1 Tax=Methylophaga sulfidovorans TaxID=45496 RepID=A0A1I3ZEH8_9GAMM|nr:phospholipase D family protein [Methylophaga sulfidovorans]SFK42121.1 Phosphatidylserine/phosphatidylglycerophosphate/cardiolipin synthase [Methylophaga sulfidovorans]